MNDQSGMNEIRWPEFEMTGDSVADEEIYTLEMGDFLAMPDVNFMELAAIDPSIRALLN